MLPIEMAKAALCYIRISVYNIWKNIVLWKTGQNIRLSRSTIEREWVKMIYNNLITIGYGPPIIFFIISAKLAFLAGSFKKSWVTFIRKVQLGPPLGSPNLL